MSARQKAINEKKRFYISGRKCINGHMSKRTTIDGSCCECRRLGQKRYRVKIRAKLND